MYRKHSTKQYPQKKNFRERRRSKDEGFGVFDALLFVGFMKDRVGRRVGRRSNFLGA
jgi:hypothetical protein